MCVLLLVALLIASLIILSIRAVNPYHVHSLVIRRDYELVWQSFSDPLQYKKLYPFWIKNISSQGVNVYQVDDQFGHSYPMTFVENKNHGVIDLKIGNEISSLRLFQIGQHSTLAIHVAKRWQGISLIGWVFHKNTVRKDFSNAKTVIENKVDSTSHPA